jgi:hypothetical protein
LSSESDLFRTLSSFELVRCPRERNTEEPVVSSLECIIDSLRHTLLNRRRMEAIFRPLAIAIRLNVDDKPER